MRKSVHVRIRLPEVLAQQIHHLTLEIAGGACRWYRPPCRVVRTQTYLFLSLRTISVAARTTGVDHVSLQRTSAAVAGELGGESTVSGDDITFQQRTFSPACLAFIVISTFLVSSMHG
jgi:hypothetical protein